MTGGAREQLLVSIGQDDVPDGAVRKRAVVQSFSLRHWLRALRKLLPGCQTARCCVLLPGLPSVLEGVPNPKFAERSIEPAGVAPATALRPNCATVHTGLAIEPTQLSHTVISQRPPSVDAQWASATGPHRAQRRYSLGSLGCCFGRGRGRLQEFPIIGGGGAGH